jgi:hypothetical protein
VLPTLPHRPDTVGPWIYLLKESHILMMYEYTDSRRESNHPIAVCR